MNASANQSSPGNYEEYLVQCERRGQSPTLTREGFTQANAAIHASCDSAVLMRSSFKRATETASLVFGIPEKPELLEPVRPSLPPYRAGEIEIDGHKFPLFRHR